MWRVPGAGEEGPPEGGRRTCRAGAADGSRAPCNRLEVLLESFERGPFAAVLPRGPAAVLGSSGVLEEDGDGSARAVVRGASHQPAAGWDSSRPYCQATAPRPSLTPADGSIPASLPLPYDSFPVPCLSQSFLLACCPPLFLSLLVCCPSCLSGCYTMRSFASLSLSLSLLTFLLSRHFPPSSLPSSCPPLPLLCDWTHGTSPQKSAVFFRHNTLVYLSPPV